MRIVRFFKTKRTIIFEGSMFDSHCQHEYMHINHAETTIPAVFFGLKLVSMDDTFVQGNHSQVRRPCFLVFSCVSVGGGRSRVRERGAGRGTGGGGVKGVVWLWMLLGVSVCVCLCLLSENRNHADCEGICSLENYLQYKSHVWTTREKACLILIFTTKTLECACVLFVCVSLSLSDCVCLLCCGDVYCVVLWCVCVCAWCVCGVGGVCCGVWCVSGCLVMNRSPCTRPLCALLTPGPQLA